MAMTKCKECGKDVSTKADKCPHCGAKGPGGKGNILGGIFFIAIIVGLVMAFTGGDDNGGSSGDSAIGDKNPEKTQEKTTEQKAAEEAACKKDLQCWGDRHSMSAGMVCDDKVEALAKYAAEWTDGFLEPKFSRFRWKNKDALVVTFIGDKIRFQNAFGALENHIYECDIDTVASKVVGVRASPGRLN